MFRAQVPACSDHAGDHIMITESVLLNVINNVSDLHLINGFKKTDIT